MICDHCKTNYELFCHKCFMNIDDIKYEKIYGRLARHMKPTQRYTKRFDTQTNRWVLTTADSGESY